MPPLTGLVAFSVFAGLVLAGVGLMQWRQSRRQTWRFLALGAALQLWWIVPALWWVSQNVSSFTEFRIKR